VVEVVVVVVVVVGVVVEVVVEVVVVVVVGVVVEVVVGVVVEVVVGVEVVVVVEIERHSRREILMAKKIAGLEIGKSYLVRCVTHYYTGKLLALTPTELVLGDAAWIADTGRFATALKTGVLNEVEPFPGNVIVNRGSMVDATEWAHALPREQK